MLIVAAALAMPAAAGAQAVTDAQIASIVVTANQVDIDAGKLASSRATRAEVKQFGALMVTDHTGVNKAAVDLVTRLGVTPQDNPTSPAPRQPITRGRRRATPGPASHARGAPRRPGAP